MSNPAGLLQPWRHASRTEENPARRIADNFTMVPHLARKRKGSRRRAGLRTYHKPMPVPLRSAMLAFALTVISAVPRSGAQQDVSADLRAALAGRWTGVLEYRDYKEPPASLKRVALPTWLSIQASGATQGWHYVYDDGPGKVVEEDEQVSFDAAGASCTMQQPGKPPQIYRVDGLSTLKSGRGTLLLTGGITDNSKPAEARLTLTVGRNLVSLLQEVRAVGTQDAFVFRHEYRFVRADAPVATAK